MIMEKKIVKVEVNGLNPLKQGFHFDKDLIGKLDEQRDCES